MLENDAAPVNDIIFEGISAAGIKRVAGSMKGSGGPSGLDVQAWQRMLSAFKGASSNLAAALAAAAKRICTTDVDPASLPAFVAARLVALDKRPGVRPIAVGEVARRIIAKAVLQCISSDIAAAVIPHQLCVGVPAACEAAVRAVQEQYLADDTDAILLIDASNAFNAINRKAALHNIARVCTPMEKICRNTYGADIPLFLPGGVVLYSREGTCQGDPLAMAMFALAVAPMICKLREQHPDVNQCWYADDGESGGRLAAVHSFWKSIEEIGPNYGYYPNAAKTVLLVKPALESEAQELFDPTGIRVLTNGVRYLGGAIGEEEFVQESLCRHVSVWCREVGTLSTLAETQPHAAYSVFSRGLRSRWRYHMCSHGLPEPDAFGRLDNVIDNNLIPAITGRKNMSAIERSLIGLPVKSGGLSIPAIGPHAVHQWTSSMASAWPVIDLLRRPDADIAPADLQAKVMALRNAERRRMATAAKEAQVALRPELSPCQRVLLEIAADAGVSSWLTAEPLAVNGFALNKACFRDGLALHYGWGIDGLPPTCVCGRDMSVDHALTCPTGGYPSLRHNELRDVLVEVMTSAIPDVQTEPPLLPLDGEQLHGVTANRAAEARLDIRARGFWSPQQDAFFDVRVTHPSASLLSRQEVLAQISRNEHQKKRAYLQRVVDVERGSFTPLVFSTNGVCGTECSRALKNIVQLVVNKHSDLQYAVVMAQLRCKIAFVLLRWSITCLRGCRASYLRKRIGPSFLDQCRLLSM